MKSRPQEILMSGLQEVLKSEAQSLLKSWIHGFMISWHHVLLTSKALDALFPWAHDTLDYGSLVSLIYWCL